jgi:hypothetical protein
MQGLLSYGAPTLHFNMPYVGYLYCIVPDWMLEGYSTLMNNLSHSEPPELEVYCDVSKQTFLCRFIAFDLVLVHACGAVSPKLVKIYTGSSLNMSIRPRLCAHVDRCHPYRGIKWIQMENLNFHRTKWYVDACLLILTICFCFFLLLVPPVICCCRHLICRQSFPHVVCDGVSLLQSSDSPNTKRRRHQPPKNWHTFDPVFGVILQVSCMCFLTGC